MATQITTCHQCAVAVTNQDTSGMDEDTLARVTANLERLGFLAHVGTTDPGGYWQCDLCWGAIIGPGETYQEQC